MIKNRRNANVTLHITLKMILFCVVLMIATAVKCEAADGEIQKKVSEDAEKIKEEFESILPKGSRELGEIEDISESIGVKKLIGTLIGAIQEKGGELYSFLLTLLGIALFSAFASLAHTDVSVFAARGVGIISSALLFDRLLFLVSGVSESLRDVGEFFSAVIPVTVAVNSLGVSPTVASTQALGMGVTFGLYSFISLGALTSLTAAIFITSSLSSVDPLFHRLAIGIKKLFLYVIGILTVLVGATFSLQSSISASADSAAMRGAKYAISNTVPIVGSTVSSAFGVICGSAEYLRGLVGGGAIAAILSLMLAPLAVLLAYRFCLSIGIFLCGVCSIGGCEGVLSPFLSALDVLIAVYTLTCVIYIVELTAFLKGGVRIA